MEDHDRAAPKGTGRVKAAGNYAADMEPLHTAKAQGYGTTLYLDAKERRYVEEFSVANFVGITRDGAFVTPAAETILESTTNKMLQQLALDEGIRVERRPRVASVGSGIVLPRGWCELSFRDEAPAKSRETPCGILCSGVGGRREIESGANLDELGRMCAGVDFLRSWSNLGHTVSEFSDFSLISIKSGTDPSNTLAMAGRSCFCVCVIFAEAFGPRLRSDGLDPSVPGAPVRPSLACARPP